jgi:hypothetical protein
VFNYWRPARRTRPCAADSCPHREQVRTNAITTNGTTPISLCTRHWNQYRQVSGLEFTEGQPT